MVYVGRSANMLKLENYLENSFDEYGGKRKDEFMSLLADLKKSDLEVYQHSLRVLPTAIDCAKHFALNVKPILFAAPGHDIGKSGLDWDILHKPGNLTSEEEDHVRQHVLIGYEKLSGQGFEYTAQIESNHHLDYADLVKPYVIFSEQNQQMIKMFGRIVSIADVYDAMHHRSDHCSEKPKHKGEILVRYKRNNADEYQMRLISHLLECDILKPMQ